MTMLKDGLEADPENEPATVRAIDIAELLAESLPREVAEGRRRPVVQ